MDARYERIISIDNFTIDEKEPVELIAGEVLKDNITYSNVMHFRIKNVCNYVIREVRVTVVLLDEKGEKKGNHYVHIYRDLNVAPGESFGENEAIILQDSGDISSVKVTVSSVIFDNKTQWKLGQDIKRIQEQDIRTKINRAETLSKMNEFDKARTILKSLEDSCEDKDELLKTIEKNEEEYKKTKTKKFHKALKIAIPVIVAFVILIIVISNMSFDETNNSLSGIIRNLQLRENNQELQDSMQGRIEIAGIEGEYVYTDEVNAFGWQCSGADNYEAIVDELDAPADAEDALNYYDEDEYDEGVYWENGDVIIVILKSYDKVNFVVKDINGFSN